MKFDVKKTNMVKCIAVILMLWHHLFGCFPDWCEQYGVESKLFGWPAIYSVGVLAKICVGIFVFLTAFGITRSYNFKFSKENPVTPKGLEKFCLKRYTKLAYNFFMVFLIAAATSFLRDGGIAGVYNTMGIKSAMLFFGFDMLGLADFFNTPTMNETWWYMSIAIPMAFIIPVLIEGYKRLGRIALVLAFFAELLGFGGTDLTQYTMCLMMGIWCAEEDIFEKLYDRGIFEKEKLNNFIKIVVWITVFVCLLFVRKRWGYAYWIDALVSVACCGLCMELGGLCPWAEKVMNYIGKHSMNIFLIHTLIFEYYFTEFIYSFKNWFLILMALLITSLSGSIMIEFFKKVIKYWRKTEFSFFN